MCWLCYGNSFLKSLREHPYPWHFSLIGELYSLIWAHTLTKGKTTVYTNSQYAFRVVHTFGILHKFCDFRTSKGTKLKWLQNLLDALLLLAAWATTKIPGHSRPNSMAAQRKSPHWHWYFHEKHYFPGNREPNICLGPKGYHSPKWQFGKINKRYPITGLREGKTVLKI